MTNDLLISAKLWNGTISVFPDHVEIKRSGIMPMFYQGYTGGKKKIPISSITAVQFKKQGLKQGFIRFSVQGEGNFSKSYDAIVNDENTVTFTPAQRKNAEDIRDLVEQMILENQTAQQQKTVTVDNALLSAELSVSAADEIAKLKKLFDLGAISEEEFSAAKKKVLGT